ncbi:hypothetical protein J1N09_10075 [Aureitalea sp. L0-47]|uniref:hypothetical protein n=1 Tax=Aureitalea sp. L0-47 TaxID=2816962 RepID=UPI0022390896|nr:hypothetical protein [Aureitalea sp. L0-47]MCW5520185.1 hypothetical protein [Aureitalea sp. L0-47]
MERKVLRKMLLAMNKIEEEIRLNNFKYPKRSNLFESSIPPHLESKEEIIDYFTEELQKLEVISFKLRNWFQEFVKHDLGHYKINLPSERELNDTFKNLTIPELHLFYQPINPETQQVYNIRSVRNWFKNNSILKPVVRLNGRRYSKDDFERFLNQGGIQYNHILTNLIFEFLQSNECSKLTKSERNRKVKEIIRQFKRS